MGIATAADAEEANAVAAALVDRCDVASDGESASVYKAGTPSVTILYIYGVTDTDAQNSILSTARLIRSEIATKPIQVRFLEAEVWESNDRGRTRGTEVILREELIR